MVQMLTPGRRPRTFTESTPDEIRPILLTLLPADVLMLMSPFPTAGAKVVPELLDDLRREGEIEARGATYHRR